MRKITLTNVVALTMVCLLMFNLKNCYAQDSSEAFSSASLMRTFEVASPSNSTYSVGSVTLNASMCSIANSIYSCKILYSLDGKENVSLHLSSTFVPVECIRTYADGRTEKAASMFSYYRYNGIKVLSELPQGNHTLEVYGFFNRIRADVNPIWPKLYCYKGIVNFTVNLNEPPKIQELTIENKTYTQTTLPLNFTFENPADWIGYSLDDAENVTITGNTSLTNLLSGTHHLVLYANDTLNNMGKAEVTFIIKQEIIQKQTGTAEIALCLLLLGVIITVAFIVKKIKDPTSRVYSGL